MNGYYKLKPKWCVDECEQSNSQNTTWKELITFLPIIYSMISDRGYIKVAKSLGFFYMKS
jgi:hypothetical protein